MKGALNILKISFFGLNARQKGNLWWHYQKKTKICCGKQASRYIGIDGKSA